MMLRRGRGARRGNGACPHTGTPMQGPRRCSLLGIIAHVHRSPPWRYPGKRAQTCWRWLCREGAAVRLWKIGLVWWV